MQTVCAKNKCAGCMACLDICPQKAISISDSLEYYNAVIDIDKCVKCGGCHKVCPNNYPEKSTSPIRWYQGWSNNSDLRKNSSSGGLATAIAYNFIKNGGVLYGCVFQEGKFGFEGTEDVNEIKKFMGSKYVKSNPQGVYKKIKNILKMDKKVLFIGLPCQVAAVKKYVGKNLEKNLYTIDLICHGTPSPKILDIFLRQYGYTLDDLTDIRFRTKAKFMISDNFEGIITNGVTDKYSIAFLNSLTYTENCYNCAYAKIQRVSDLTLGDSWGSNIEANEQKKGISLVLCQSEKGKELLHNTNVHLENVNLENAIKNNHQLDHPSVRPKGRKKFFKNINKKKFNVLVFQEFPKQCLRQDVKQILIRMKIIKGGGY